MIGSLVGKCPAVTVGIGGVTVECIVDTGSMVGTITESFYNKYLCDISLKALKVTRSKWLGNSICWVH